MKKALVLIAAFLTAVGTYAQGQVNFITVLGPSGSRTVDAPVRFEDGTGAGSGFTAQLFLKVGDLYTALTPATVFRTDVPAAAAYVVDPGSPVTVPGFEPGTTAPLVLRAWETAAGIYEDALIFGESPVADILLGGGTLPPTNLEGLQGFTLTVIPEPSTMALAALGVGALLLRRRKK